MFSKKNNNDMPLQKLRMKQKVNYLKNNFIKTKEELKVNKKIANYQDIIKRDFYKNKGEEADVKRDEILQKNHFRMLSSNENSKGRDGIVNKEMPPKYTVSNSSGSLSSSFMKKVEDEKRNRFGNLKNIAYDRIGSKSPATRRKNVDPSSKESKRNAKFNNIPRHIPKVFEVEREKKQKGYKKRLNQKNDYYDGQRANTNISSSSDSSISLDLHKRGEMNVRRTLANPQRTRDSSLSSSPSRDFGANPRDKYSYKLYSHENNPKNKYMQMEYEEKLFFKTNVESGNGDIYDKYNAARVVTHGRHY